MPIRADLRKLYYTGEAYRAKRRAAFEAAGAKFNDCGECIVAARCQKCDREAGGTYLNKRNKWVVVQLGRAHLDQDPANDAPENIRVLCRACHMDHDLQWHALHARETRMTRKDAARPLLASEARL